MRYLRSRLLLREPPTVVCTMTMHELNRPKDRILGDRIRDGAGVDCQDTGEICNGIL